MNVRESSGSPPRAGRREWIGLAVLSLPTLLLALDLSVIYLALPHISNDLGATGTQQLWVTDIYGFLLAGFLVTMGTLGDRVGRRKLMLIGAAAFGVASVFAAYSPTPEVLIAARALMGITGATLMPSTLALISNMFLRPKQKTMAIAIWSSCFMGGAAVGPVVGGAMLETFWWGSVFLLGVPVMVLLLVAAPLMLPEYRDEQSGSLDLVSVTLSLLTVLPLIYALKEITRLGPAVAPLASAILGVAAGYLFVRRQSRLASPLIDLRLFGNLAFSVALVILLVSVAAQGGNMLLVTQYLQLVEGLSPLWAGLWLIPSSVAMVVGSLAAPALSHRAGRALVIAFGTLLATAGFFLLALVGLLGGFTILITGAVVVFFGVGLVGALITDLVVSSAPPSRAGSAASISQTSGDFGIAFGVAVFGSVGAGVYRLGMDDAVPEAVATEEAGTASDSIAGALQVVEGLSGPAAEQLRASAQQAFTLGLNVSAGLSALLTLALCALALTALRRGEAKHTQARTEDQEPSTASSDEDIEHHEP